MLEQEVGESRSAEHHALVDSLRSRDTTQMAKLQKAHFTVAWRLIDNWSRLNRQL